MRRLVMANPVLASVLLLPLLFYCCMFFGSGTMEPLGAFFSGSNIIKLRFFRLATGFVVGGALAVSGLAYQAALRNVLAEPYILGISGGACLGAALCIATGLFSVSVFLMPAAAFFGAVLVLVVILLIARGAGREFANNVMLSGVIAAALCNSVLMFIISIVGLHQLNSITWWMLGSLEPHDLRLFAVVAAIVFSCVFALFLYGREINLISLGEEMTHNMGASPRSIILISLGVASLMTAAAVSVSGTIGFVGLIVPHITRRLFGADHRRSIPLTMLWGGVFLMVCDTFAKTVMSPQEIPVGVITACLGGPFFIWLLNRRGGRGS